MDWDKLRIFHAVADVGSLTHAGDKLNLSQSAVSRQIRGLEESLNATTAKAISMQEEVELLQREKIVREHASGLAETQVEKLNSLVEDIDFEDAETFSEKVAIVKESYFTKKIAEAADIEEDDDGEDAPIITSDTMAQYLTAIQKTNK